MFGVWSQGLGNERCWNLVFGVWGKGLGSMGGASQMAITRSRTAWVWKLVFRFGVWCLEFGV